MKSKPPDKRRRKPARGKSLSTAATAKTSVSLEASHRLEIYYYLRMNRVLEDRLSVLYRQGKVQGGLYSSRGQEGISVGSAYALQSGDVLAPMIRNLGSMLVRGVRPQELLLQYLQREGSPCRGRDTSLHFGTPERGLVAPISHLGTLIPVMTGVALASRMRGLRSVALTYIGDGATSTGDFHEGLALASVRRVPLVLIIENNRYAYSTPVAEQSLLTDLADRAGAYGIPKGVVDGNDVIAVYEATSRAVAMARAGQGPVLLEAKTMRMKGHSEHDDAWYVPEAEHRFWERRDPILLYERKLRSDGTAREKELREIDRRCEEEIDREVAAALDTPFPRPESGIEDVYAPADAEAPVNRVESGGRS